MKFTIESKQLNLKVNWKIARNESLIKENFFITLHSEDGGKFISEIAPNIRYGETKERVLEEFSELSSINLLTRDIVLSKPWAHSFKSAVMNLLLKIDASEAGKGIADYLGVELQTKVPTSFSIPIMDLELVEKYLQENSNFNCYKLKISDSTSYALLEKVSTLTDKPLRIDANEGFKSLEDYLIFEKRTQSQSMNIEFIEQPFPAAMIEEYRKLKPISKYEIIADESVEADFDAELFSELFHGVNIKQMKACGVEQSKELLLKAKSVGLKTMIGCMIESSLGISEALYLASLCDYIDLDGALLLSNDPYNSLVKLQAGYLSNS